MTDQQNFRMPATGEGWRHYKGGIYTIIGMGVDEDGLPVVVYTKAFCSFVQLPAIYTRKLDTFLQTLDVHTVGPLGVKTEKTQRFKFDRDAGHDPNCPFISERPR